MLHQRPACVNKPVNKDVNKPVNKDVNKGVNKRSVEWKFIAVKRYFDKLVNRSVNKVAGFCFCVWHITTGLQNIFIEKYDRL